MPIPRRVAGLALAAGLLGACTSGGGDAAPEAPAGPSRAEQADAAAAVQSAASILRANLTSVLQQHVFLTGAVTATVVAGADPAPAAAELDANSVNLSRVVGAVAGGEAADRFLDLWRGHVGLLTGFAAASAAGDEAGVAAAKAGLDAYRDEMAGFLNAINPHLAKDTMADSQKAYLGAVQQAIAAQAEGDPAAAGKLKQAAENMPRMATLLVAGITKNAPGAFEGRFDGSAATLRSVLASKLQEHVYLSWMAAGTAAGGADKEAVATLDDNAVELANIVGSAYGDEAAGQFLGLWRSQVSAVVDYARARAGGDGTGAQAAAARVAAEPPRFAAFLGAANPRLDEAVLAADLGAHARALLAAIDSQAAGSPSRFADVRAAAGRTRDMAARLSTAIAAQFPDRFS